MIFLLEIYKTVENRLEKEDEVSEGCWINVFKPTAKDINFLTHELQLDKDFVNAALDEEESSRIEKEEDQTLIIIDTPVAIAESSSTDDNPKITYSTMPVSIIITPQNVITICLNQTPSISDISCGLVKNVQTNLKTRFVLNILLRTAQNFLVCLKQINREFTIVEKNLSKNMRNKELLSILNLEKSLVYFSTSLKANEMTLEKIFRGRVIKLYEEDEDLLRDVLIEVKQAVDMSNIYAQIMNNTMEGFSSIINNNLNISMKTLTILTTLMSIPNMVYGFYGMNVQGLPITQAWFPFVISISLAVIGGIVLFGYNKK